MHDNSPVMKISMKEIQLTPLEEPVTAEISLPGCIGYTIRALNIAAMVKGSVEILNPLKSDDTYKMLGVLKTLGIAVEEGKKYFRVNGDISDIKNDTYTIDIGLSGRTARSVLALLCIVPGEKIVTCSEPFKKRPIGDLVQGLRQMGATISYLEKEGYLPVKISSNKLNPGTISMKGSMSSQYFSAIMMIAPLIGDITIRVADKQSSKPYIDMTIAIMKEFGITVTNDNYRRYHIKGGQQYKNITTYPVEPEATSASYFFAIAAITKSTIRILQLSPQSFQGDILFVNILQQMGCKITENIVEKWIEVTGTNTLNGVTVDLNNTPDLVPTLAVVGAFAKGTTTMTNIAHARVKETDRIQAPSNELTKMGIETNTTQSSLTVHGGDPKSAVIDTYHDHRMAMAFAVAGAKLPGMTIDDPDVVNKSFPQFWDTLEELGIKAERENRI
jgi:3-phosphoshikimate 1-carboxyvinyltransferase